MNDKPIVIIGGGSIGQRHIKNLHSLGFSNIFCLKRAADPSFETAFQVEVLTHYRELERIKPWAVFICNPTSLHVESLDIAVRSGANIFMEKPLIHNEEGLQKARSILEGYDKVFFIGFMLRFHPLVKALKGIIEEGDLGTVYSARFEFGSYLPYWHPWEDYKNSYASNNALGGGVINTITHELDLVQYFFGKPESTVAHKINLQKLGIEVEELFEGILIYSNKLVTIHLDYLQKDYDRRIRLLFDEGSVTWNWHENELVVKKHKSGMRKIELKDFEVNQLYIDELKSFFELIEKGTIHHNLDKSHAFENTSITLALHQSSDTSKNVKI